MHILDFSDQVVLTNASIHIIEMDELWDTTQIRVLVINVIMTFYSIKKQPNVTDYLFFSRVSVNYVNEAGKCNKANGGMYIDG